MANFQVMAETTEARWLLLIHQIPPKPDYLRVKISRRLRKIGAVAIKNSVYALPRDDETLEDFQWTLREIAEGGGEASICEAKFVDGLSNEQVEALFNAARQADYAPIAQEVRELLRQQPKATDQKREFEAVVSRLRRRLSEAVAIDFFDCEARQAAEGLVSELEASMGTDDARPGTGRGRASEFCGRTWVTRKGLRVDRMASAWLIRRFIDPRATFKFVPPRGYRAEEGELRFDMFEAEFTHEGDHCTFEVLVQRIGLDAPGLRPVAEIVHDIDLKDGKFGRPEKAGIERLIIGICTAHEDDEARLARGFELFDSLYESFKEQDR